MMPRTHKSEALAAVHEMIEGLHEAGAVDKRTLQEFDEACLAPATPLILEEIKAIRKARQVSQPVFARYLNVSTARPCACFRSSGGKGWRRLLDDGSPLVRLALIGLARPEYGIPRPGIRCVSREFAAARQHNTYFPGGFADPGGLA